MNTLVCLLVGSHSLPELIHKDADREAHKHALGLLTEVGSSLYYWQQNVLNDSTTVATGGEPVS